MAPARPIRDLTCDDSFRAAAGKILWTRFDEMMSFTDVAVAGEDPEGVHDMRVASRRLRAALELFQPIFPRRELRPLLREVKGLADALGGVRDLDVMLERLTSDQKGRPQAQREVLQEMVTELHRRRDDARGTLIGLLDRMREEDFPRRFLSFVARETT